MAKATTHFRTAALGLLVACALTTAANAQLTPVRFRLDWVWQAPQSIWTLAYERGYFREEGLDVTIDRGYGGPDTTGSVASGAYDIGFTDINNMVEFNGKNPDHKLQCVLVVYDATLAAVITRKGNGINTPKDLEGRVIGAPLTTGGRTLFPAFARVNGIDETKITWETISIQLQDQQFAQGKFDAVASFATTSLLNLKLLGVDLQYADRVPFFQVWA
jgi:NitT/TauT family transport system substrate-binding protein